MRTIRKSWKFYTFTLAASLTAAAAPGRITEGSLVTADGRNLCPLKHTDVNAEISGPLSRVRVTQEFENPFPDNIEAVYVFPLPADSAVDEMTMTIGDRTVRGTIKERSEARAIYEKARRSGQTASLLDQERPNVFTQAVANIAPGAKVKITIGYVETLPYEAGRYEFVFPMVVGPRYIPGHERVLDAARITPPITPEGTRAGHDISVQVKVDAGMAIDAVDSPTHEIATERPSPRQVVVRLKEKATIPNKDFILRYSAAGRRIQDAVLAHRDARGGFFTLLLEPPARAAAAEVTPKELVFVLDTSGSMMGFPIEKAKETMHLALQAMNPRDTFNLITFSGDTEILFPRPVPATAENVQRAQEFLASRFGRGGTEMMKAIRAALDPSGAEDHVRVVCFMTDGEVGNDLEILAEIRKHPQARVFAFGIGSSVNRFLLDNMALYGRGEVEYVGLNDDGSAAARRFHERVRSPLLTDISLEWQGVTVTDVYPQRIPDLFSAKPVVISGRYEKPGKGIVRLRGRMAGLDFVREIALELPASEPRHDVLATLWARRRVAELMSADLAGLQSGNLDPALRSQIVDTGLRFKLMTQFTSFVAVEETVVTEGGAPRRVEVPVEMPEGVSYTGIFGEPRMRLARAGVTGHGASGRGIFGGLAGAAPAAPAVDSVSVVPLKRRPAPDWRAKLDPGLLATAARSGSSELTVQVYLRDTSPATVQALSRIGFQIVSQPKTGTLWTGRIRADKLEMLARIEAVRYVALQR